MLNCLAKIACASGVGGEGAWCIRQITFGLGKAAELSGQNYTQLPITCDSSQVIQSIIVIMVMTNFFQSHYQLLLTCFKIL